MQFATIHGNQAMMEAAVQEKGDLQVLAVTVLTSLDRSDLEDLGFRCDIPQLVLSRARRALAAGCDGVISSGLEAPMIRDELGQRLLVVSPGIRPVENRPADDQKRIVSVPQAFRNGADHIVVGRRPSGTRQIPTERPKRSSARSRRPSRDRRKGRGIARRPCSRAVEGIYQS